MKLIGNLIDDEELEQVSGGGGFIRDNFALYDSICPNSDGGEHDWVAVRGLYFCNNCDRICKDRRSDA